MNQQTAARNRRLAWLLTIFILLMFGIALVWMSLYSSGVWAVPKPATLVPFSPTLADLALFRGLIRSAL